MAKTSLTAPARCTACGTTIPAGTNVRQRRGVLQCEAANGEYTPAQCGRRAAARLERGPEPTERQIAYVASLLCQQPGVYGTLTAEDRAAFVASLRTQTRDEVSDVIGRLTECN